MMGNGDKIMDEIKQGGIKGYDCELIRTWKYGINEIKVNENKYELEMKCKWWWNKKKTKQIKQNEIKENECK